MCSINKSYVSQVVVRNIQMNQYKEKKRIRARFYEIYIGNNVTSK